MRLLTAGESHGKALVAILEGFPKGVKIVESKINAELAKRTSGPGRGKRMELEQDRVEIVSGLRNKITLGSPIAMLVKNKDVKINPQGTDTIEPKDIVRPGHADLAGALKYNEKDINNILERASARETASRVCAGSVCKQFLALFGTKVASYTKQIGSQSTGKLPDSLDSILAKTKDSLTNTLDKKDQAKMLAEINRAKASGDTLGGIVEIWAQSLPPGLGSFMHFDQRLDAKLAGYLMSIPAVKGVEIGAGFGYAASFGSKAHDAIYHSKAKSFFHKTNNSGGIEGGISNGEPIVIRIAMKPIATLRKPLASVGLKDKKKKKAPVIRSDVSAVVACSVVAESMCALALVESYLDKFGSDSLAEITRNYRNYLKTIA